MKKIAIVWCALMGMLTAACVVDDVPTVVDLDQHVEQNAIPNPEGPGGGGDDPGGPGGDDSPTENLPAVNSQQAAIDLAQEFPPINWDPATTYTPVSHSVTAGMVNIGGAACGCSMGYYNSPGGHSGWRRVQTVCCRTGPRSPGMEPWDRYTGISCRMVSACWLGGGQGPGWGMDIL